MSEELNETCFNNVTETCEDKFLANYKWHVIVYFAFITCGCVTNLIHVLALLRSRKNGVLSLVMQIAVVDVAACYVALTEIVTLHYQSWWFSTELCPFSKGMDVLVNSLTIYFLVCFDFHVISLWNLNEREVTKNNRNPLTTCNSSRDDSNECLVAKQENANRLVTIDYRKRKNDISIIFPAIFVWIVSLSLSVPDFTLSSTLQLKENYTLCAIIDMYHGHILHYCLLLFKIILPMVLLLLAIVVLTVRLSQTSKSDIDNVLTKKKTDLRNFLIFAIATTGVYFLVSFPRQILQSIHIISHSFNEAGISNLKMPPLFLNGLSNSNITLLAMLHYSGSVVRPLLCLGILPGFPHLIRTKIFVCWKIKK